MSRRNVSASLPTFPWDTIAEARRKAQSHPDGIVDLSMGTPVDPAPGVAIAALTAAGGAHGYPQGGGGSVAVVTGDDQSSSSALRFLPVMGLTALNFIQRLLTKRCMSS